MTTLTRKNKQTKKTRTVALFYFYFFFFGNFLFSGLQKDIGFLDLLLSSICFSIPYHVDSGKNLLYTPESMRIEKQTSS